MCRELPVAAIERNEREIQPEAGSRQPIVVGVVGPIGAGKSTLTSGLARSETRDIREQGTIDDLVAEIERSWSAE